MPAACFNYAVDTKQDLWFATKDTISKKYDHTFKDIFQEIYENEYQEKFKELGIEYFYTLDRRRGTRVMKAKGGFIWACKNYDRRRYERYGKLCLWFSCNDDLRFWFLLQAFMI